MTGAVLAGGRSRRFGQPKAMFVWQGKPLVEHVLDALHAVCIERLVIAKPDTPLPDLPPDVRLIYDEFEAHHPLSGMLTALRHARCEWVFVCAVDMPFLNPELIRWMARQANSHDIVVPESEARLQPLHALYRRAVYATLRRLGDVSESQGRLLSMQAILRSPDLRVRVLTPDEWQAYDPDGRSFTNWNAPRE
ncbi:MAG: molybdenum cofactor guanylyltransferase [Fimbriimonadales bacterium]